MGNVCHHARSLEGVVGASRDKGTSSEATAAAATTTSSLAIINNKLNQDRQVPGLNPEIKPDNTIVPTYGTNLSEAQQQQPGPATVEKMTTQRNGNSTTRSVTGEILSGTAAVKSIGAPEATKLIEAHHQPESSLNLEATSVANGNEIAKFAVCFEHQVDGEMATNSRVVVAGSFNNWATDNDEWTMKQSPVGSGQYALVKHLPSGRHTYKFVVNGVWVEDHKASLLESDGFGGKNAVLVCSTEQPLSVA